jgi:ketosteroid isomerase-like protein
VTDGRGRAAGLRATGRGCDRGIVEERAAAAEPEDLARLLVERVNAGDLEGVVALYEPQAVLALPGERVAAGHDAIRRFYADLLASKPRFAPGDQRPALRLGDLALTSTRLAGGGATAEIARRQPDGSWRWAVDRPDVAP